VDKLSLMLNEGKYRFRIVSLERLRELGDEIEKYRRSGCLDQEFYRGRLSGFAHDPPPDFPGAQSIIIVAVPHAKIHVAFEWRGRTRRHVIPPTYLSHLDEGDERLLAEIFDRHGYRLAKAVLPLKQLAVRSGLGVYGRNNICYIPGGGSYQRLVAFFTDAPCEKDPWRDNRMLERCGRCSVCADSCPTGAISSDRFLLRAERCLTYLNEENGEFPAWLDPSRHHCLVGCMVCQAVCPENKRLPEWNEDVGHFSESETGLIMRRTPMSELPAATVEQLAMLDIVEYYDVLPRNLGVLFNKESET